MCGLGSNWGCGEMAVGGGGWRSHKDWWCTGTVSKLSTSRLRGHGDNQNLDVNFNQAAALLPKTKTLTHSGCCRSQ